MQGTQVRPRGQREPGARRRCLDSKLEGTGAVGRQGISLALSADSKRLVTGSIDGTTRIWNANTGKELCRLLTLSDGTWVVLDDKGRFDSGADGDIFGIHWVSGMETSPLRDRVPGLLAKLLAD